MLCIFIWIHRCFTIPVFSMSFISQLLIAVHLVSILCSVFSRAHQEPTGGFILLQRFLIPHLYLISELILDLYVFYLDGALMSKKPQSGYYNLFQPQQNLEQRLYTRKTGVCPFPSNVLLTILR